MKFYMLPLLGTNYLKHFCELFWFKIIKVSGAMKREEMSESDLYFAMRVINQIRPSLDAGTFSSDLAHLLILSEEQVESGCAVLRDRFNLDEKQQDMLNFIQFVLNSSAQHGLRNGLEGQRFAERHGGDARPHRRLQRPSRSKYMVLHPENIRTADIAEDYRQHVMELMTINSPDVMLVCFVIELDRSNTLPIS